MKYSSFTTILFFGFNLLIILNVCDAKIKLPKNISIPAVLAFGDSIVDQGNNNNLQTAIKCDHPPYGKDFLGGKPTGRFCNGKTPADFMAEALGIKEYVPAYLDPLLQPMDLPTGVSFASGATGYDPQTPQLQSVLSLSDEISMFKEYIGKLKALVGEERSTFIIENSLYLIVAGSNDLANTYFTIGLRKLQHDINSYTDFLIQKATEFVKELHKLGAKRMAVFGDPPLGCLPSQRTLAGGLSRECNDNYNKAAQMYNSKLIASLKSLNYSFNDPKARIIYTDIYNPLLDLIQNHDKYGFTVVDRGCCGTGTVEVTLFCTNYGGICSNDTSYLFWDSYHPTEQGYRLLVNRIIKEGIKNFF